MDNEVNLLIPQVEQEQVDLEDKKSLHDLDISRVILIKNPNNEFALGYCGENKLDDQLNTSSSERFITHQHYGTISNQQTFQMRPVVTPQEYSEAKIHKLLIKYVILLLSMVLITLDVKNIRNRIATQDEIIAELRTIHIQMDDIQLYQIFWSFLLVYIISFLSYCVCVILSILYDTPTIIRYSFRLLMFILIYQFIEIILRRYDFILIFLRIVMILLIKIWLSLAIRIRVWTSIYPEFSGISVTARIFNRSLQV